MEKKGGGELFLAATRSSRAFSHSLFMLSRSLQQQMATGENVKTPLDYLIKDR